MTIIVANAPSWTDIVTAIGAVLAGLALPLAFIQLGALRQDRPRARMCRDEPALPNGRCGTAAGYVTAREPWLYGFKCG